MLASSVHHLSVFSQGAAVARTLEAARREQAEWASVPVKVRLKKVRAFRRLLADRGTALAEKIELPERSFAAETWSAEILPLAEACKFLEARAGALLRPSLSGGIRSWIPGGLAVRVERSPWGLVLVICAGNYPVFLPGVQALQALVAGNAVLLKPAPGTGAILTTLAEMLVESGIPAGLVIVLDESPESAQKVMVAGVDRVLFTGSSETGKAVLSQLAETLTPATLELSGCDSVFVHPQADLELVVDALRFGLTFNGSATCIAPRRVFVTEGRAREMEERLATLVEEANPVRMTSERSRELQGLVLAALGEGARLVGPGMKLGARTAPVVLADVNPEMEVTRTDIFAPVVSIFIVKSLAEALELDRQCPYALGASIFGPARAAADWAAQVQAGVVVINDTIAPTADARVPFGGRGKSGFGVTRGGEGLLELTQPKTVIKRSGRWRPHFQALVEGDEMLFESLLRARHSQGWRQRTRGWFELGGAVKRRTKQASKHSGGR